MKEVHATLMTDTWFRYKCACRKGYHTHGNGGEALTNRVEHRSSHCPAYQGAVTIVIDDDTVRKLKKQKSKSK